MLRVDPAARPSATECSEHPFFWSERKRLQFAMDTSDFMEKCERAHPLRLTLEKASPRVLGLSATCHWGLLVDAQLLSDAGKHRKYNFRSLRDYLRLMRNKWNHHAELAPAMRRKLSGEDGIKSHAKFLHYFTQFAPQLLLYCYQLVASARGEQGLEWAECYLVGLSARRVEEYRKQVRVYKFRRWMRRQ